MVIQGIFIFNIIPLDLRNIRQPFQVSDDTVDWPVYMLGVQKHGRGFLVRLAPLLPEKSDEGIRIICRVEQEGLFEDHGREVGGGGDGGCGGGRSEG